MAIYPNPDRNVEMMKERWNTTRLVTDYYEVKDEPVELREIVHDDTYFENSPTSKTVKKKVMLD